MTDEKAQDDLSDAINDLTDKVSTVLLKEYMDLPQEMQIGLVLIQTTQLLLANILCHVALNADELQGLINEQSDEIRELTMHCAHAGFGDKFKFEKH